MVNRTPYKVLRGWAINRLGLTLHARRRNDLRTLAAKGVVEFGEHSYGVPVVHVWHNERTGEPLGGRARIGRYTSIADDVHLFTGGNHLHRTRVTTWPVRQQLGLCAQGEDEHPGSRGDVVIGHDVWLASGAIVMSGVTVGDGAVVGAYSVVSRDVRPFAVVAGNPAVEVSRRFPDEVCDGLLALRWWDQPLEWVREHADLLCAEPDLAALAAALGRPVG